VAFLDAALLRDISWQAFERLIARLLWSLGYDSVRMVGQSADGGADLLASKFGKRWLFQVKRWQARVNRQVVDRTVQASHTYGADVPTIVAIGGFEASVFEQQQKLLARGQPLQLWDSGQLLSMANRFVNRARPVLRPYQEIAVGAIQDAESTSDNRALIALATGLGKTIVIAEAFRRLHANRAVFRALVLAHTNELVYQLERAFWKQIDTSCITTVWNGAEQPSQAVLNRAELVFACVPTVRDALRSDDRPTAFDMVVVDECHHAGSDTYREVLDALRAGQPGGPVLVGLTATPWRADENDLEDLFGPPRVSVDIVAGLRQGYLSNVDYRIFTDNINWNRLSDLKDDRLSPRRINRTLFIDEWDDAVVDALEQAWYEQNDPRAIVFCGTIDHALVMRDKINARRFAAASAIFSSSGRGRQMSAIERNRILADFSDRKLDVICAVDIFNEGIDVPDVNLLVFQRVTHSRRIFVQQLGRGLRISEGKERVIVLDFVSDIRRFAAGIDLKDKIAAARSEGPVRLALKSSVTFRRVGGDDRKAESFLREWLQDVSAIEEAGEDAHILRYPPKLE
jgi:superfamily II DNA or RNA helicase